MMKEESHEYACDVCGATASGWYLSGGWWRAPSGWYQRETMRDSMHVCSGACARREVTANEAPPAGPPDARAADALAQALALLQRARPWITMGLKDDEDFYVAMARLDENEVQAATLRAQIDAFLADTASMFKAAS